MTAAAEFAERLEGVRKTPTGWQAKCPSHDDRTPSLSVSEGRAGGVVIHCHAGCTPERVCEALGLELRDLQPPLADANGHRHVAARYAYHDADGTHLYDVLRFEPKGFAQAPANGKRGAGAMDGVKRVLYRLPDVLRTIQAGGAVWVCEGEKDCDRLNPVLAEVGAVATTNPGGAGKWRPEYSETLKAANVVIVADRDESGRQHAGHVAAAIEGVAASVQVVEPAQGKDAADHLSAGFSLADFRLHSPLSFGHIRPNEEVADIRTDAEPADEPSIVSLDEFVGVDEPGATALIGDPDEALIPEGGDVMAYGDGGTGKTTLMVDGAFHWAAGDDWLGMPITRPLRVLIIENEGPRPLLRAKLRRKREAWNGSRIGNRVQVLERPWAWFTFADEAKRAWLAREVRRLEVDIIIAGPVARLGMDEAGTLAEVRAFMALVADVRRRSGRNVACVLVHHENKTGKVSGAWEGSGDTLLHVSGQGNGRTRLYIQKARWASSYHATTLNLLWTDGEGFAVDETEELTDEAVGEQIIAAITEEPGIGWTAVEKATPGVNRDRRRSIRDGLFAAGRIVNVGAASDEWLDHCPKGKQARLFLIDDPTVQQLRPAPGGVEAQSAPTAGRGTVSVLRPAPRLKAGAVQAQQQIPPRDFEDGG